MELLWEGKAVGANKRLMWSPVLKRMISNPAYAKFKTSMAYTFMAQRAGQEFEGEVEADINVFVHPSRDADSLVKPILDAMQEARVYKNDRQVKRFVVMKDRKKNKAMDKVIILVREYKERV